MNGLTYIRIRCNVSQTFLAQKLGVTRQAVNLWESRETAPPAKRLAQLKEFFGIDEKYFGALTDEKRREIDATPAYRHEEDGHTYYCYVPHAEFCVHPDLQTLLVPPEDGLSSLGKGVLVSQTPGSPLISIDDKYQIVRQELKELLSNIDELTETSRYPMGTQDKLSSTHRILHIFSPLVDSVREYTLDEAISPAHRMLYYFMLLEVMAAIGLVYGSIDLTDLPQTEPVDSEGAPWHFGIHPGFIKKLSALLEEELEARKSTIPVKIRKK